MRSFVASAALAAAIAVLPAAAGYAPAWSQDFSITNDQPVRGTDWFRQLQAWWDVHAYYPREASEKNLSGDIKIHLVIHPNGEIWTVELLQKTGVKVLDEAGFYVFHNAYLRPVPPNAEPQSDVFLTEHYVMAQRSP